MSQLRTSVQKHGVTQSIKQLTLQAQKVSQDFEKMSQQRDTLQAQIVELQAQKDGVKQEQKALNDTNIDKAHEAKQAQIVERREQVLILTQDGMSQTDIANELGVSLATIKRDTKALNGRVS